MHPSTTQTRPVHNDLGPAERAGKPRERDPRRYSEQLGDELQQHREHAGLTVEAVAEHLGWSPDTLSDTELGSSTPSS
ncbi:helix-turn-helix domain-containing protein [Amycolatopsis albispora]|uniref:helix-turn-helix domain-containing protein n=1 Tax=Amycolatopsis albispora TaxID=1804986 RepID=UPI000DE473C8|nr:helix-turn-helix transcriptional regulator [Amycolatopsis albispora]